MRTIGPGRPGKAGSAGSADDVLSFVRREVVENRPGIERVDVVAQHDAPVVDAGAPVRRRLEDDPGARLRRAHRTEAADCRRFRPAARDRSRCRDASPGSARIAEVDSTTISWRARCRARAAMARESPGRPRRGPARSLLGCQRSAAFGFSSCRNRCTGRPAPRAAPRGRAAPALQLGEGRRHVTRSALRRIEAVAGDAGGDRRLDVVERLAPPFAAERDRQRARRQLQQRRGWHGVDRARDPDGACEWSLALAWRREALRRPGPDRPNGSIKPLAKASRPRPNRRSRSPGCSWRGWRR